MRISDWSSDVCSSDLHAQLPFRSSRLIGAERQPTSDCPQSYQQDPENALQTLDRDHCPVPHALAEVRTALRQVAERARGLSDLSLSPARTAFAGFSKLAAGASSLTGRCRDPAPSLPLRRRRNCFTILSSRLWQVTIRS